MTERTSLLNFPAGIKVDGTRFSNRTWSDGQWVRFKNGKPRKMGGYNQLIGGLDNIPRRVFVIPAYPNFDVYFADYATLKYFKIDQHGNVVSDIVDRTPAGFNANVNNAWQFDTIFSTTSDSSTIIAHAAPNMNSIYSDIEAPIYFGDSGSYDDFEPTGISVSGGISVFQPILFMFGNSGDVKWSLINDPTTVMEEARIAGSKIVAGASTRGGNTSPAGLLWSLDSLIRVTQVGVSAVDFNFDTVSDKTSILSSRGIMEYDGQFYWAGIDKFYVYNGTVQELPNDFSSAFFFDNLNYEQRQKVWATKNTKYGEIWWHFPYGDDNETTHAVIYNVRYGVWYNTLIERGDGYFSQVFPYPIWSDNTRNNDDNKFGIWMHEFGNDKVDIHGDVFAIQSYIDTPVFSNCSFGIDNQFVGVDKNIILERIEPDFLQTGDISVTVTSKPYAQSEAEESVELDPITPVTQKIDPRIQGREMSIRFESDEIGGFYEMGDTLVVLKPGDERPT